MVKSSVNFSRWVDTTDACGNLSSPIELLVLGSLRYLGRGWMFDNLEEATSISEETHRVFFHIFIRWRRKILYKKYVGMPQSAREIGTHIKEMEQAGLFGCVGSVDATHIGMLRCPYSRWNQHVMICIGLCLALGLVCLCGTDLMGLDWWDWASGTG
jgi:hypothetical protein